MKDFLLIICCVFGFFAVSIIFSRYLLKTTEINLNKEQYTPQHCDSVENALDAMNCMIGKSTVKQLTLLPDICYYISISKDGDTLKISLLNYSEMLLIPISDISACNCFKQNVRYERIISGETQDKVEEREYLAINFALNGEIANLIFEVKPFPEYCYYNEVAQRNVNLVEYINERISNNY